MGWSDFFGNGKGKRSELPWQELTGHEQLDGILKASFTRPQLIFKHSTRCSISSMALERFGREWDAGTEAEIWYLDLLQHRDISNAIEARTGIVHQSPQAILLKDGEVAYDASHSAISADAIAKAAAGTA